MHQQKSHEMSIKQPEIGELLPNMRQISHISAKYPQNNGHCIDKNVEKSVIYYRLSHKIPTFGCYLALFLTKCPKFSYFTQLLHKKWYFPLEMGFLAIITQNVVFS